MMKSTVYLIVHGMTDGDSTRSFWTLGIACVSGATWTHQKNTAHDVSCNLGMRGMLIFPGGFEVVLETPLEQSHQLGGIFLHLPRISVKGFPRSE